MKMANPQAEPDGGGGWVKYGCVASEFNRFNVGSGHVDIFVSNINWNDSGNTGHQFTTLGASGSENGIQFGVNNGPLNWLTSTDRNNPDHFTYDHAFEAVCVTGDSHQEDNTGGYWIHIRAH
jgi:hypothetical protein